MTSEIKPRPDANHECDPDCPYQDVGIADDGCPDGCGTDKYCSPALRARVAELESQLAAVRSVYDKHELRYYADEPPVPRGSNEAALRALASDLRRALTSGGTDSGGDE